jgi:hypothetical protein
VVADATQRATGTFDASVDATQVMFEWMYLIGQNRFTSVDFDRVRATGVGDETYEPLRFGTVKVAVNGDIYRNIANVSRLRCDRARRSRCACP